jgi:O-antigen ligase
VLERFSIDAPGGIGAVSLDIDLTRDALMRLLGYIGAFVVAYALARDAEAARKLMLVILCTTTLVSAYGFFMLFDGNELLPFLANTAYRGVVTGSFVNRNSFATYANLGVVIGFVWLFEPFLRDLDRRDLKVLLRELLQRLMGERGLFLVALLVLATASLLTASRGGFLSIAAGLLVILFLLTRPRLPALVIATPLIAAAVWGLVSVSGAAVLERFEQTSDARIDIWAVTSEMIEDRFWLGHGYGTYEPAFNAYRDDRFPLVVDKAYNTYLEHAAELGIPATLLLVLQCVVGVFGGDAKRSTRSSRWPLPPWSRSMPSSTSACRSRPSPSPMQRS